MKTVLITAGPVSESIDPVRKITNNATGTLGALTAEALYRRSVPEPVRVLYVCERGTCLPGIAKINPFYFRGTGELSLLMKDLLLNEKPDAVIHSMAVSDYRVETATGVSDGKTVPILRHEKMASSFDRVILELVPTPKIIRMIKDLAPKTFLVGFKLLDSVPEEVLLEAARKILAVARCDLVLANDAQSIRGNRHTGYLVSPDGTFARIEGKAEIAESLAVSVLKALA